MKKVPKFVWVILAIIVVIIIFRLISRSNAAQAPTTTSGVTTSSLDSQKILVDCSVMNEEEKRQIAQSGMYVCK